MESNKIIDKIIIKFEIELLTGMHIGTSEGISIIGDVDSYIVRDPITNRPIIPGSSLKGKMRSLIMRNKGITDLENDIDLSKLFGCANIKQYAKLQFVDSILSNESVEGLDKKELDLPYAEVKFENTIHPTTLVAKPRQIERAVRGSKFAAQIIYTVTDENEVEEDFNVIKRGMELLELDYIGGSGTRGYGRVKFNNIVVEKKLLNDNNIDEKRLEKILKGE